MNLKLFGKNAIVYAIGNIGLRATSFLLIPLYTHALSVSDYGLLAALLITIQIMMIFMNMGMRISFLRFAKEYEDNKQIKVLFGTTTFINIIGGVAVSILAILFFPPFFRSVLHIDNNHVFIILTCSAALVQSLTVHAMSYYRARNEAGKFMMVGISSAVILFILNWMLLYIFNLGIIGVLSAHIVTYFAIFLFLGFNISSKTDIGISVYLMPKLFRFGFPFTFVWLSMVVIGSSSIYFLSYFKGLELTAIYSLGYKLAKVLLITTVSPFQLAFLPFVFTNLDSPEIGKRVSQLLTYIVLITTFMGIFILLGSRILLPLIAPPEYSSAYLVILLLIPGIGFIGLFYFGGALLSAIQKTYVIGFTMVLCSIISLILNVMLIPLINQYGAVIASNVSYIIAGLIVLILGIRAFPIQIEWKRIGIFTALFAFFLLLVLLLNEASDIIFYSLTLTATCASLAFIYFGGGVNSHEKKVIKSLLHGVVSRIMI